MKRNVILSVLVLLSSFILFQTQPVFSQTTDEMKSIQNEIKALKEGQKTIEKDLQEIKNQLRARQAPAAPAPFKETEIDIDHAPVRGEKNAKLVLIEFSDYQ